MADEATTPEVAEAPDPAELPSDASVSEGDANDSLGDVDVGEVSDFLADVVEAPASFEDIEEIPDTPAVAEPAPVAEPVVEPQPVAQAEPPVAEPAVVEQPAEVPAESPAPVVEASEEQRQEAYTQAYAQATEALTDYYKLPEEVAEQANLQLGEGFAETFSGMLAKVYLDAVAAAGQYAAQHVPPLIEARTARQQAATRDESEFFERWPQLRAADSAHMETIYKIGSTFRQINPQASKEDFISQVGAMSMVTLGLTPEGPKPEPAKGNVVPLAPYVPAAASGGGGPVSKQSSGTPNIFEEMVEDAYRQGQI